MAHDTIKPNFVIYLNRFVPMFHKGGVADVHNWMRLFVLPEWEIAGGARVRWRRGW